MLVFWLSVGCNNHLPRLTWWCWVWPAVPVPGITGTPTNQGSLLILCFYDIFFWWSVGWCFAEVVALPEAIRRCLWSPGFYLPGCLWGAGGSAELVLLPLGWAGAILCVRQLGSALGQLWGPEAEVSGLPGEGRGKIHLERAVNKRLLVVLGIPGWAAARPWSQGVWRFAQRFLK